jgi:hypothetical protein
MMMSRIRTITAIAGALLAIALGSTAALGTEDAQRSHPHAGETWVAGFDGTDACVELETFDRLALLYGDNLFAFQQLRAGSYRSFDCINLKKGERVEVESATVGRACVRRPLDNGCRWTGTVLLRRPEPPSANLPE